MIDAAARETMKPVGPVHVIESTARWIAAVICIFYGFAKVNGSQFNVIDSVLTRPLGEVSGFWLTWHYFGFSPAYGMLIAIVQIVGGVLLIVPRTSLLGALVLLPVAGNIVLIDIFFGVRALLPAVVLLGCLLLVIARHARPLLDVVLIRPRRASLSAPVRAAVTAALIVTAYAFSWWVANYNNRRPTAIDGIWTVVADSRPVRDDQRWSLVFFERNNAHLAVFRSTSGEDDQRYFEVDATGTVRVRQTDVRSAAVVMEGRANDTGALELEVGPAAGGGHLRLERLQRSIKSAAP